MNKSAKLYSIEHIHFPNAFFAVLHTLLVVQHLRALILKLFHCSDKSIVAEIFALEIPNCIIKSYFFLFCYMCAVSQKVSNKSFRSEREL